MTKFCRAASESGVALQLMPDGFSRRVANTSYYNDKAKAILWHVELVFARCEASIVEDAVNEHTKLSSLISSIFEQRPDNLARRLRLDKYTHAFQAGTPLRLYLRAEGQRGHFLLNSDHTLAQALSGHVVVEFPVINVVLPDDAAGFTELPWPAGTVPPPAGPAQDDCEEEQ